MEERKGNINLGVNTSWGICTDCGIVRHKEKREHEEKQS